MFDTDFFAFRMTHSDASVENLIRVEHYSVPRELDKHLASVFNTIEMFDQIFKHVQSIPMAKKGELSTAGSGYMTPDAPRSYYNMIGTSGSVNSTQTIFASVNQYFSPANLAWFQGWTNSPVIPAVLMVRGHVNDSKCMIHSNCQEANLDMQYIMTMSPNSPTTFWYSDKWFSDFFIEIANTVKPPKIIRISYGTTELSNLYSASVDRCRKQSTNVDIRKSDGKVTVFRRFSLFAFFDIFRIWAV